MTVFVRQEDVDELLAAYNANDKGPTHKDTVTALHTMIQNASVDYDETKKTIISVFLKDLINEIPMKKPNSTAILPEDIALKNGNSMDAIDVWVEAKIKNGSIKKDTNDDVEKRNDITSDEQNLEDGRIDLKNMTRMNASGNNSDCSIHAFLTSVSPAFRKIDQSNKNTIANYFRRNILHDLYTDIIIDKIKTSIGNKNTDSSLIGIIRDQLDLHAPGKFLSDGVYTLLGNKYNMYVLLIEKSRLNLINGDKQTQNNGIIIYNTGGNHFEPVKDTGTNEYIFKYDKIKEQNEYQPPSAIKNYCMCKDHSLKEGDILEHNTNKINHIILSFEHNDTTGECKYIYITKYKNNMSDSELNTLYKQVSNGLIIQERIVNEKTWEENLRKGLDKQPGTSDFKNNFVQTQKKFAKNLVDQGFESIDKLEHVENIVTTINNYTYTGTTRNITTNIILPVNTNGNIVTLCTNKDCKESIIYDTSTGIYKIVAATKGGARSSRKHARSRVHAPTRKSSRSLPQTWEADKGESQTELL